MSNAASTENTLLLIKAMREIANRLEGGEDVTVIFGFACKDYSSLSFGGLDWKLDMLTVSVFRAMLHRAPNSDTPPIPPEMTLQTPSGTVQ